MPIYDYVCARCDAVTEVIHGIHAAGPRFCPACGAEGTLRKGFTTPTVHFKGSGWAKKDRAASASPGKARASKSSAEAGTSTGEAGTSSGETSTSTEASPAPAPATSTASTDGRD